MAFERVMQIFAGSLVAAALTAAPQAVAAAERFNIDQSHTNIVFLIDHLGYSKMIGQFQEFAGDFTFDPEDLSRNEVAVTIKTSSVDTDHEKRDEHLRSPDFFNSAEFPDMTFVSTGVEKTGDNTGKLTGDLTLLGVTKPVTLDVTFNKMAPHPIPFYKGVLVAGFSARGSIKRSDFGMTYGTPGDWDAVTLWIEAEGHKAE